jgi:hypothetical protein
MVSAAKPGPDLGSADFCNILAIRGVSGTDAADPLVRGGRAPDEDGGASLVDVDGGAAADTGGGFDEGLGVDGGRVEGGAEGAVEFEACWARAAELLSCMRRRSRAASSASACARARESSAERRLASCLCAAVICGFCPFGAIERAG